jgi:factor associated with neutral sphingomyelinase activation
MRSAWDIWLPLLVQHLNTLLQHRFSDAVGVSPVTLCDTSGCSSRDALANGLATGVCDFDQFFLGYRILPLIVEAVGMKIEAGRFISQPLHQEVHAGHVSIALDSVAMVVPRAWRLRHTAFEIYVRVADVGQGSGLKLPNRFRLWQGFMFDVGSTKMRDACIERLKSVCPNMYTSSLQQATEEWEEQGMSNYEYLIFLNFMSGRTFNDLTQYPVMPWTRIDFEPRNKLAPGSPKGSVSPVASKGSVSAVASDGNSAPSRRAEVFRSFRDLSKNVGALSAQLLAKVSALASAVLWERASLTRLQAKERLLDMREGEPRFLFGSHFSTPMYVVYFLVRIYPKFMMRFTSGTFDLPDRLFHSVADTWKGVVRWCWCCVCVLV